MGGQGHGHPYSPADLELQGFVPQRLSAGQIATTYLGASLSVALAVWLVSGRCGKALCKTDRLLMCWWAFTGLTHLVLEGNFLFSPDFYRKEDPNFFDELLKEYSKGDSRYATGDPVVIAMELLSTGFSGPAALLAVYAISSRKSYSHILQFTVCLSQIYPTLFYFITGYFCRYNFWSSPYYLWAYFIGPNTQWLVVPSLIAIRSWKKISAAFRAEKVKTG